MSAPDKLPHALLLAGPAGLGKQAFAMAMAARLLCEAPLAQGEAGALACGCCSSCNWLATGNHPDFRLVQPEAAEEAGMDEGEQEASAASGAKKAKPKTARVASGPIRIDQIRGLADFVFIGSHRHGRRVVILNPAEAMNPAAANALLKILEEPPASICFILVSDSWRKLLPTIRSRCRIVVFGRPTPALAASWLQAEGVEDVGSLLQLTGGAPLLARDWAQQAVLTNYRKALEPLLLTQDGPVDPVSMAAKWGELLKADSTFDLPQLVDIVQKWVMDLTQVALAGSLRYHLEPAWRDRLEALTKRSNATALLGCDRDLRRIRAVARHPLNTQLFLEDMAARYLRSLSVKNN
ncbi:DNA polymerase III subunit delta' [Sterolibacterium denitrificans]|nr:DNA polymerase III subunit delta' [Sterolibacterium denitrificans]